MMVIELNGAKVTGRVEGTDNFEVSMSRSGTDNAVTKSFSSELTFYDDGYAILKQELVDNPNGFINYVNVDIYDDCCNEKVYSGVIRGDGIDWCEQICSITASVVENDPAIDCIKSSILADNWNGFQNLNHPAIRYCLELRPNFTHALLILLATALQMVFFTILVALIGVILVIFGIIYVICNIIAGICSLLPCNPPNCNSGYTNPLNVINDITDLFNMISEWVVGCGRFHPSPYVRDYITNVCDKCGLTFQSSILNDPQSIYYDSVLFSAPVEKGRKSNSTDYSIIQGNEPITTLSDFMTNYVSLLFNGEWRISNNVLIFERKDYFFQTIEWLNTPSMMQQNKIIDNEVCYSWRSDDRPAYAKFSYSLDSSDYIGNEARTRFEDIVEWNNPPSPMQSGEKAVQFPFGMARFRDDGIDTDIYDIFGSIPFLNAIWGGAFTTYSRALIMNQHTAFQYKIMIANVNSPVANTWINFNYSDGFTGGNVIVEGQNVPNVERYNYPYWVKADNTNNLYDQFWYIDNPRLPSSHQFDFSFEFIFDCDQWKDFSFDKYVTLMQNGVQKNGIVTELKVNFSKKTINVQGIV